MGIFSTLQAFYIQHELCPESVELSEPSQVQSGRLTVTARCWCGAVISVTGEIDPDSAEAEQLKTSIRTLQRVTGLPKEELIKLYANATPTEQTALALLLFNDDEARQHYDALIERLRREEPKQ